MAQKKITDEQLQEELNAVVNGEQISKTSDRIEDAFAERIYMSVANKFHINHGLTTFNNGYK